MDDLRDVTGWCAWAWAEHGQGRVDRARAGFCAALALDPGSIGARFGLASMLIDAGDIVGATALSDAMSATAPDRPDVLWLHARLALARGEPARARAALMALLSHRELDAEPRAEALLLLGIALGDLGLPGEAFAAAASGKALQRTIFARRAANREGEVAKLQRLAHWMQQSAPADWRVPVAPVAAREAKTHVFLLGFPRSGTTLLEQVLAGHPKVRALEEAPTLATAYQAFLADAEGWAVLADLPPDEAAHWRAQYWADVHAHGVDASGLVFGDKQPAGTLYLPIVAKLFPAARIIFAVRDPRDVVLSCFRNAFQMNAMTYAFTSLNETAACYAACMTLAGLCRQRLALPWMNVRHEELVDGFEAELQRITGFLGLDLDPAMADVAASARSRTIRTPSAPQVRAGLNRRGLGRWQAYATELSPVLGVLGPWIERFCYSA